MFERFTDRARRVVVLAQEEVLRLDRPTIGDELLLVGLAAQPEATAAQVLAELGVDADRLRARLPAAEPERRKHRSGGHIPFTPVAKLVMENAVHASTRTGARAVGTEHLLIALIEAGGAGVDVLRELEVDVNELRNRAERAASEPVVEETQATPWSAPRADVGAQLASIESTLKQILDRLTEIERKMPGQ
jgi:ATP-dependent Clp protease ATP-binding subunit ClpC